MLVALNLSLGTAQTNTNNIIVEEYNRFPLPFLTRCLATKSVAESNMR